MPQAGVASEAGAASAAVEWPSANLLSELLLLVQSSMVLHNARVPSFVVTQSVGYSQKTDARWQMGWQIVIARRGSSRAIHALLEGCGAPHLSERDRKCRLLGACLHRNHARFRLGPPSRLQAGTCTLCFGASALYRRRRGL